MNTADPAMNTGEPAVNKAEPVMNTDSADQTIADRILELARQHAEVSAAPALDARLREDLRLDSLTLLSLVVDLENHFRVAFDEQDEATLQTLNDVVQAVRRKLDATATAPATAVPSDTALSDTPPTTP